MKQEQEQTPPGAGNELDRLVAEKMGWREADSQELYFGPGRTIRLEEIPHYSTQISAAWRVVDFLKDKGYWFSFETHFHPVSTTDLANKEVIFIEYVAEFYPAIDLIEGEKPFDYGQVASTAPLAIVLAFLALPDFEVKQ